MNQEWILQRNETRRRFANSTWVPLRASVAEEEGQITEIGYRKTFFGCGSVAFPPQHRELAERLTWGDIGIIHGAQPHVLQDGTYSSIDQYRSNGDEVVGVELVFEHSQPVIGEMKWILNPDLVVALRLVKEGLDWVRPEEDFVVVARERIDDNGSHRLLEIKREFLMDYLAARNLSLRLSYYRQRVINIASREGSEFSELTDLQESRDGGRFELRIRSLEDVFGGSWAAFRVWRTDIDTEEDAPVMGPEGDSNTEHESWTGTRRGYQGVRIEGEFWRGEWIDHKGQSTRVRGDEALNLTQFIVDTAGSRLPSVDLRDEDVGRWLWFRAGVVSELLDRRGFAIEWYTAETGAVRSTSGYATHFGINASDLVTVYAHDIARLAPWEQHVWAAHNVVPDGKVAGELLAAQVRAQPANTHAVERLLLESMRLLEAGFLEKYGISLFTHALDEAAFMKQVSRFASKDQPSLLRLAKDLVRHFSDRLNVSELRKLSTHPEKEKLGSNKLLQSILAQEIGEEKARTVFGPIVGAYDMRVGDAHPTGSKVGDALALAGIDTRESFLRQGQQLISNFGQSIWRIGKGLFEPEGGREGRRSPCA